MKDDKTLLYIAGALGLGYLVFKLGKPVQDTGAGVATAVGGLGSGISEIGTSAGNAVSDVLSITDPIKAVTSKITDQINSVPVVKSVSVPIPSISTLPSRIVNSALSLFNPTPSTTIDSVPFVAQFGKNYNPFTNPTSQSFFTASTPAGSVAPLAIQNTIQLAKSDPVVRAAISGKIATPTGNIITSSSTARYTGGVGKSQVTQKKK